jgi:hypothetical protein
LDTDWHDTTARCSTPSPVAICSGWPNDARATWHFQKIVSFVPRCSRLFPSAQLTRSRLGGIAIMAARSASMLPASHSLIRQQRLGPTLVRASSRSSSSSCLLPLPPRPSSAVRVNGRPQLSPVRSASSSAAAAKASESAETARPIPTLAEADIQRLAGMRNVGISAHIDRCGEAINHHCWRLCC